jgi:hypothetical protein
MFFNQAPSPPPSPPGSPRLGFTIVTTLLATSVATRLSYSSSDAARLLLGLPPQGELDDSETVFMHGPEGFGFGPDGFIPNVLEIPGSGRLSTRASRECDRDWRSAVGVFGGLRR